MSGSTGYPWEPGQVLTAADLNAAIQLSAGPSGPPGVDGKNGLSFLQGSGPPAGTQPVGTSYLDISNGDVWQFT